MFHAAQSHIIRVIGVNERDSFCARTRCVMNTDAFKVVLDYIFSL